MLNFGSRTPVCLANDPEIVPPHVCKFYICMLNRYLALNVFLYGSFWPKGYKLRDYKSNKTWNSRRVHVNEEHDHWLSGPNLYLSLRHFYSNVNLLLDILAEKLGWTNVRNRKIFWARVQYHLALEQHAYQRYFRSSDYFRFRRPPSWFRFRSPSTEVWWQSWWQWWMLFSLRVR